MIEYVLGFVFCGDQVLLKRKCKGPEINIGKWNGIGGKVEPFDADPAISMDREAHEEVNFGGDETDALDEWFHHGFFCGTGYRVQVFSTTLFGPMSWVETREENEPVAFFDSKKNHDENAYNLNWLIQLCIQKSTFEVQEHAR